MTFNPDYTEQLRPPGAISIQDAERGRQSRVLEDFRRSEPELIDEMIRLRVALRQANQAYNECEAKAIEKVPPGGMRDVREAVEVEADRVLKTAPKPGRVTVESVSAPTGVPDGTQTVPRMASRKGSPEQGGAESLLADPTESVPSVQGR